MNKAATTSLWSMLVSHPHASVFEGVTKCHFPLKAVVFKSGYRSPLRFPYTWTPSCTLAWPGGNPWANLKSTSHRCHPILVAFVWKLTKETIVLPLGCLQGGLFGDGMG